MEGNTTTTNESQAVLIEGFNFQGEARLVGQTLNIEIVQFRQGNFYKTQITNAAISKNIEKYKGFENVKDIYKEIICNREMNFSNKNSLVIYFQPVYNNKPMKMELELSLTLKSFLSENLKTQSLLRLLESLSLEKIKSKKYLPQMIEFKGDQSNVNYKIFQVNKETKVVKMLGVKSKQYVIFNHFDVLPQSGIYCFKVKIIKTQKKEIFLGVCAKSIVESMNVRNSHDLVGLHLNSKSQYGIRYPNLIVQEGVSVFMIEINMDKRWISWHLNEKILCTASIEKLAQKSIYPMLSLRAQGDTVQLLDQ